MAAGLRQANHSEESAQSTATSSLVASAANAEKYLEHGLREVDLNDGCGSAKETLHRWLSIKSVISRASSDTIKQQEAALDRETQVFRSIGKGFCGEIFDQLGQGRVLKRAYNPQNLELWNDYSMHAAIHYFVKATMDLEPQLDLLVPKVFDYIPRECEMWWEQNRYKWQSAAQREPTDLLESERILPLPKIIRYSLINHYCPPHKRLIAINDPRNRDCLIRVYLGARRNPRNFQTAADFCLRNLEADLSVLDELGLEKEQHAQAMAIGLAQMHWNVKTDAADVEFVLGPAPVEILPKTWDAMTLPPRTDTKNLRNSKRRTVHLWLLDFNQCRRISMDDAGIGQVVAAFWQNDPYYPRPCPPGHPDAELWAIFRARYLTHSIEVHQQDLAQQFIDRIEAEAMRRVATAAGPPQGQASHNAPPCGGAFPASPTRVGLPQADRTESHGGAISEETALRPGRGGRRRARGGGGHGRSQRSSINLEDLV